MKEIKIIDLLNMIAEGKEAPKKIKYKENIFCYDVFDKNYCTEDEEKFNFLKILPYYVGYKLNDTVEIIEENEKGISREELENRIENALEFLETQHGTYPSGKMWREALKNVLQGKNADDVYFEDNNKIEKLKYHNSIPDKEDIEEYKQFIKEILKNENCLMDKINEIIDKINNM